MGVKQGDEDLVASTGFADLPTQLDATHDLSTPTKPNHYAKRSSPRKNKNQIIKRAAKDNAWAQAYLEVGGNASEAAKLLASRGQMKSNSYKHMINSMSVATGTETFRNRLVQLLENAGLNPKYVTNKLWEALEMCNLNAIQDNPQLLRLYIQLFNNCMIHLRAIIGLDAPRNIHHQVDKRTVTLSGSMDDLHHLALKAKDTVRRKGEVVDAPHIDKALLTSGSSHTIDDQVTDHTLANSIPSKLISMG